MLACGLVPPSEKRPNYLTGPNNERETSILFMYATSDCTGTDSETISCSMEHLVSHQIYRYTLLIIDSAQKAWKGDTLLILQGLSVLRVHARPLGAAPCLGWRPCNSSQVAQRDLPLDNPTIRILCLVATTAPIPSWSLLLTITLHYSVTLKYQHVVLTFFFSVNRTGNTLCLNSFTVKYSNKTWIHILDPHITDLSIL